MKVYTSDVQYMRGSGGVAHGLYVSRGAGIGSIFSSIYSSVVPLIRSVLKVGGKAARSQLGRAVLKDAKKTAMKAGINVVGDALQGKNVIRSSKSAIKNARQDFAKKLIKRGEKAYLAAAGVKPPTSSSNLPRRRRRPVAMSAAMAAAKLRRARQKVKRPAEKKAPKKKVGAIDLFS